MNNGTADVMKGGFGEVRFETRLGMRVAVKTPRAAEETVEHEAKLLLHLHHPFLPLVLSWSPRELVMADLGRQSVTEVLIAKTLARTAYDKVAWCVASALSYLHSRSVYHADVKCDNVVVDASGDAVLVDFNLAEYTSTGTSSRRCGSAAYLPPEVYRNQAPWDAFAADVWSYSVLYFAILYGTLPFDMRTGTVFETYAQLQPHHGSTGALRIALGTSDMDGDTTGVTHVHRTLLDTVMQPDPKRRPRMHNVEKITYCIKYGLDEVPSAAQ